MAVTLKDIASACNVNVSTVSRALRDDASVTEKTRKKIHKIAQRLGYVPNLNARSLVTGSTQTIFALIPGLQLAYDVQAVEYASERLFAAGYELVLGLHHYDQQRFQQSVQRICQMGADAALLIPTESRAQQEDVYLLHQRAIPFVCIDRGNESLRAPLISTDNQLAASDLLEKAYNLGAKHYMNMFDPSLNEIERRRYQGVLQRANSLDVQAISKDEFTSMSIAQQAQCVLLASGTERVDEIFGALPACHAKIALFDRALPYAIEGQQLICHQDFAQMAEQAVCVLLELLNGTIQMSYQEYLINYKSIDIK